MRRSRAGMLLRGACGILLLGGFQAAPENPGAGFHATLSGANEVPRGDPNGMGMADIGIFPGTQQICTHLEVDKVGSVTMAHIHRGAAGANGPPVVTLALPEDGGALPDEDDDEADAAIAEAEASDDCIVVADALLAEIQANPAGFYVNVHTQNFPAGAIRGQLAAGPLD